MNTIEGQVSKKIFFMKKFSNFNTFKKLYKNGGHSVGKNGQSVTMHCPHSQIHTHSHIHSHRHTHSPSS